MFQNCLLTSHWPSEMSYFTILVFIFNFFCFVVFLIIWFCLWSLMYFCTFAGAWPMPLQQRGWWAAPLWASPRSVGHGLGPPLGREFPCLLGHDWGPHRFLHKVLCGCCPIQKHYLDNMVLHRCTTSVFSLSLLCHFTHRENIFLLWCKEFNWKIC